MLSDRSSEPVGHEEAVECATDWVRAVMDERDLARAWTRTTREFRKVLAQYWIVSARADLVGPPEGWEAIADGLAGSPSTHRLWPQFATERLARWREFWTGFSAVTWGVKAAHQVRPDVVVVTFVEPRGKLMSLRPGPPLEFRHLAVRETADGWRLAGVDGANLFEPGWPPSPS